MALAMPIPACEHSTFAIGRRAPRGFRCWGRGRRPRADCRHGPGEAFQQAPDVLLRTVPRRLARRGIVFTAFSRRRVGLRGAQETIRDPAREANFFGFPGTASSRQRLFCGTGLSPQPLIFRSVPSSPGANPPGLDAFALPLAFAIWQRRHPAVGPPAPQSARLSDARVTLTGDDIAPSADLGISRRPSPPQASTRTLRTRGGRQNGRRGEESRRQSGTRGDVARGVAAQAGMAQAPRRRRTRARRQSGRRRKDGAS
jgi:hypothetical protein